MTSGEFHLHERGKVILLLTYMFCRDEAGEKAAPTNGAAISDDEEAPAPVRKSAFASMTLDDDEEEEKPSNGTGSKPEPVEDDDDQFGGLMGAIKKSEKKEKKGKKSKKQVNEDIWDELGEDVAGNAASKDDQMEVDGQENGNKAQVSKTAE